MNNRNVLCNWCGLYYDRLGIYKHKSGLSYCDDCKIFARSDIMPHHINPIDHEEFDKNLKRLLDTPPLKLKDLKERLKKEREKKRNDKKKSRDKKTSK